MGKLNVLPACRAIKVAQILQLEVDVLADWRHRGRELSPVSAAIFYWLTLKLAEPAGDEVYAVAVSRANEVEGCVRVC